MTWQDLVATAPPPGSASIAVVQFLGLSFQLVDQFQHPAPDRFGANIPNIRRRVSASLHNCAVFAISPLLVRGRQLIRQPAPLRGRSQPSQE